ncbi:sigma-54-dependent Fis family transcriptional regulator [Tepiditoga spiralis]|uniref:Sigma-54-dependent Fis family transcriptional regulator n=1 Tax=Tepiditoga spiralis TaxID=2108365 RepID=A0A7G1G7P4_9BACT|nr:sigma 54-interacting transcriptional regulator [Tepiditoga spiralis]BBE31396.1 sigma-54-dependent Fis family transcriptional regulator [Tepiditoga spiralis]
MTTEELIKNIIDQLQEGVIAIDEYEKIIFINKSAKDILELDNKEKILGKNVIDVVPNTRLHDILRTGEREIDRLQNLGNKVIITSRTPIKNDENEVIAAVAVFRDVTSIQKLAEEVTNLKEIEALLTSIIDYTSDAISVADQEGRVIMVNRAYTKITGLTPREVIGKPATIDIAEGESLHIRCAKEKKPLFNVKLKVVEGKKDVIASVTPIFVKNEFRGSVAVIHDISELKRLGNELEATKRMLKKEKAKYSFEDIVAKSLIMQNSIKQAQKAAQSKVNVLLVGEYGVGKEVMAQAIHNSSRRKDNPFLRINFSLLTKEKQIDLLFGENSYIYNADKGTLYLENVHLASFETQEKLLKLLKENEFDSRYFDIKPDVKFIFSTTENLRTLVTLGKFSRELYYKISVVTIKIPPLRERKEDIPLMAKQKLHYLNQKYGRIIYDFTEDAIKKLMNYNWGGNIRELENIIDRSLLNMDPEDKIVTSSHIPDITENNDKTYEKLKDALEEYEKKIIIETLEVCHGNKTETAKKLGITVRNLYYKLDRYGIK